MPPSQYYIHAVNDDWFNGCLYRESKFCAAVCETFRRVCHFDMLFTIALEAMIILGVLFTIYGFGLQQKLREFYNDLRLMFIRFAILMAMTAGITGIFHMTLLQQPACIQWNSSGSKIITHTWRAPSNDILLVMVICTSLAKTKITHKWLQILIAVGLIAFYSICCILQGYTSVAQTFITWSIGAWLFTVMDFIPPIGVPIASAIVIVADAVLLANNLGVFNWNYVMRASLQSAVRGIFSLIISVFLYIRYGMIRKEFRWTATKWDEELRPEDSGSGDDAVVPNMADKDVVAVEFGSILKRDIIDTGIMALGFLFSNYMLSEEGNYVFFS